MNPNLPRKMLWIDIETTGLQPEKDRILEVGLRITNWEGGTLDHTTELVWTPNWEAVLASNEFVWNMHAKSGLTAELQERAGVKEPFSMSPNWVAQRLRLWVDERLGHLGEWPMCGSSVHMDRAFLAEHMTALLDVFTYRNIDVSGIREACQLVNPDLYAKIPGIQSSHRPQGDISNSVTLWRWLLDNFMWTEDPSLPTLEVPQCLTSTTNVTSATTE